MGKKKHDATLRRRIAGWVEHLQHKHGLSEAEFARRIDFPQSSLNKLVNAEGPIGLDAVVRMHREMKISLDVIISQDAPPVPQEPPQALAAEPAGEYSARGGKSLKNKATS